MIEDEIKRDVGYDPETGEFVWLADRNNRVRAGNPAGYWNYQGYLIITIRRHHCRAHRIAWLLTTGEWPKETIDHINGNTRDNRLRNLREATLKQNLINRGRRKSITGFKGVSPGHYGRYRAVISVNGKRHHLGHFDTPEIAYAAYVAAAKDLHGEFARFS